MSAPDSIGRRYVELVLAIDRHLPGYADAYWGPREWKAAAARSEPRPLAGLARLAGELLAEVEGAADIDEQRRDYLRRQLAAMATSIELLQGAEMSLREEVERLYDVTPKWTDEEEFSAAHRALDELLPGGGPLAERLAESRDEGRLDADALQRVVEEAAGELRRRTRETLPCPPEESFEIAYVSGKPWPAYHWYLGGGLSRVEINTDLPLHVGAAAFLVAHELYPGHHTESAVKDRELRQGRGFEEHCVLPLASPATTVAEGIAERGRRALMPDEEWVEWHARVLHPAAGLGHLDAERRWRVARANERLNGVYGNVVFLISDRGATDDEAVEYFRRFGLASRREAESRVRFIRTPRFSTYYFTYLGGAALLDELLSGRDRALWLGRLLREPVTPSRVRAWIAAGGAGS